MTPFETRIKGLKILAVRRHTLDHNLGWDKDDLVNHAKHVLCVKTKTLFKDPIWDAYTEEELLIEYFAWQFSKDLSEDDTKAFVAQLEGVSEDEMESLDRLEKLYMAKMQKKAEKEGDIEETF